MSHSKSSRILKVFSLTLSLIIFSSSLIFADEIAPGVSSDEIGSDTKSVTLSDVKADVNYTSQLNTLINNTNSINTIYTTVLTISSNVYTITQQLITLTPYIQNIDRNIGSLLSSGIQLSEPFIKYFMPDPDSYSYSSSSWRTISRRTVDALGNSTLSSYTSDSAILQLRELLRTINNSNALDYQLSLSGVLGDDNASALYNQWFNLSTGNTYSSTPVSLWADIRYLNRILSALTARSTGIPSNATFKITDYTNTERTITSNSIYDYLRQFGENTTKSLGRLAYVLANDDDIALRNTQQSNIQSVTSNFTSGKTSVTPAKLGNLKTIGDDLSDNLSSNASINDGLSILSSGSDSWSWFSQNTADNLDSVQNTRKQSIDYIYITKYNNELDRYVGKSVKSDN